MTGFLTSPQEMDWVSSHIICLTEGTKLCLWDTCSWLARGALLALKV